MQSIHDSNSGNTNSFTFQQLGQDSCALLNKSFNDIVLDFNESCSFFKRGMICDVFNSSIDLYECLQISRHKTKYGTNTLWDFSEEHLLRFSCCFESEQYNNH